MVHKKRRKNLPPLTHRPARYNPMHNGTVYWIGTLQFNRLEFPSEPVLQKVFRAFAPQAKLYLRTAGTKDGRMVRISRHFSIIVEIVGNVAEDVFTRFIIDLREHVQYERDPGYNRAVDKQFKLALVPPAAPTASPMPSKK